jgi:hypothetical protein
MGPKHRPKPAEWSLEKAKRDSAKSSGFDEAPPKLPAPKDRRAEAKSGKKGK